MSSHLKMPQNDLQLLFYKCTYCLYWRFLLSIIL